MHVGEITMICDEVILSEVVVIIYTILTCFFPLCKMVWKIITFLSCQQKNTHVFNWLLLLILDFTVCYHI